MTFGTNTWIWLTLRTTALYKPPANQHHPLQTQDNTQSQNARRASRYRLKKEYEAVSRKPNSTCRKHNDIRQIWPQEAPSVRLHRLRHSRLAKLRDQPDSQDAGSVTSPALFLFGSHQCHTCTHLSRKKGCLRNKEQKALLAVATQHI